MEHRDSPEFEPERTIGAESKAGRRFAGMIESPVTRRVALRRLLAVGGLILSLITFVAFAASKLLQWSVRYVHQRPEHQISFARVELEPPPDPWVKGGSALILETIREGAKLDETVSLLDLNLEDLGKDFRRCPWVKEVIRIDRSHYGRLVVHLVYRRPVAVVPLSKVPPVAFVVDDEAVVLPDHDVAWTINNDPYQVRGMGGPLITIQGLPASPPTPRVGLRWKRKVEEGSLDDPDDPMVSRAARLARFLEDGRASLKSPAEAPSFASIYLPHEPDGPFFLLDRDKNWICWGRTPGDEKPGKPSSEARWKTLLAWVKGHSPRLANDRRCLYLEDGEARLEKYGPSSKK